MKSSRLGMPRKRQPITTRQRPQRQAKRRPIALVNLFETGRETGCHQVMTGRT